MTGAAIADLAGTGELRTAPAFPLSWTSFRFGNLRSLRIGLRLTCCFAVMSLIMLMSAVPAVWQLRFYQGQVNRLNSIDRRVIAVLKVNNRVLAFRDLMQTAAVHSDEAEVRRSLVPFRAAFVQDTAEAYAALRNSRSDDDGVRKTLYTLLSYQTAIPGQVDAILEMAASNDWQSIHYRLDNQVVDTSRALAGIVGEIEEQARIERSAALKNMAAIRYRVMGIVPLCCFALLLAASSFFGVRVTRSISDPLAHLEAGAQALGSGNFEYRLAAEGKDELATVAMAFNTAAARIELLHSGLERLVSERTADLQEANARLHRLSSQDPLTGVANRRVFDQTLQNELMRAREAGVPLSLLMVDVDHFKRLNDAYGHQMGDECLRKVVARLQSMPLRATDLIARYGGEEFAVVLGETDTVSAFQLGERMRRSVEDLGIPNCGSPDLQRVSVSIGVATAWPEAGSTADNLVHTADQALYRAKRQGRNRTCL